MNDSSPARQDVQDAGSGARACRNCATTVSTPFCPQCGQDQSKERLTVRGTVATAVDEVLELEQPLLRTIAHLSLRPGGLCRDYVLGKRKGIVNPLKYCLAAAAIHTLTIKLFGVSAMPSPEAMGTAEDLPKMQARVDRATELQGLINVLALPFFAAVCRLIFINRRVNFAEWYAISLFAYGHLFVITWPMLIMGWLDDGFGFWINMLLPFAYVPLTVSGFLGRRLILDGVLTALAIIVYFLFVVAMAVIGMILANELDLSFGAALTGSNGAP